MLGNEDGTPKSITELDNIKDKLNIAYCPERVLPGNVMHELSILPLINYGHKHFGENQVQEALEKWLDIKNKNQI